MFQVTLGMMQGTDMLSIERAMPSGDWLLETAADTNTLIFSKIPGEKVGLVKIFPKKITIKADESQSFGEEFWQDFARKYPEFNPFDLHFGIIYNPENGKHKYELDEWPKSLSSEVLEEVSHYKDVKEAYYVQFRLGDWHSGEDIFVQKCQKINSDGSLGEIWEDWDFRLGNLENDKSM